MDKFRDIPSILPFVLDVRPLPGTDASQLAAVAGDGSKSAGVRVGAFLELLRKQHLSVETLTLAVEILETGDLAGRVLVMYGMCEAFHYGLTPPTHTVVTGPITKRLIDQLQNEPNQYLMPVILCVRAGLGDQDVEKECHEIVSQPVPKDASVSERRRISIVKKVAKQLLAGRHPIVQPI